MSGNHVNSWASSFRDCDRLRLSNAEAAFTRDRFVSLVLRVIKRLHCPDDSVKQCRTSEQHSAVVKSMGSGDRLSGLTPGSATF